MARVKEGPPRFMGFAMWVATLVILGGVVYAAIWLFGTLGGGLGHIRERSEKFARNVEEERLAGEKYKSNIDLSISGRPRMVEGRLVLTFKMKNNGSESVIKAYADVTFSAGEPGAETEKILLLDDTPSSVRSDRELVPGEERELNISVDPKKSWNIEKIEVKLSTLRVAVKGGKDTTKVAE